jgi:hypothetical protein
VSSGIQNLAATVFDHPWVLVLIAVVTLVRWLVSKAKSPPQDAESPPPPPPSNPIPRGGETRSEEERIRRFLEALGQPPGSSPPPVTPRRRQVTPKTWVPPSPLPPLKTAPPPLPAEVTTTASLPPPLPVEPARSRRTRALDPAFEVRDVALQASSEPQPEVPRDRFAGRIKLGTPQDLRTAIVLREIFGPPRSLQPLDLR